MKKVQFTLDEDTLHLLETLAAPRAGNRSFVIREAVRRMAEQEGFQQYLDWLEVQPSVRASLESGLADERQGRRIPHEQVLQRLRSKQS